MSVAQPIDAAELARRFSTPRKLRGTRWAAAQMRRMRHVVMGGEMFTTEEWLAEWLAAESIPQTNWPLRDYDPVDEMILSRVIQLMGALAAQGKIQVKAI